MGDIDGDEDEQPRLKVRGMEVGFSSAEWRRPVTRRRAGSALVFCGKLAALEVLRRGFAHAHCRFVWWALQGLAVSGAPALGWFRRWPPFRVLADASDVRELHIPLGLFFFLFH